MTYSKIIKDSRENFFPTPYDLVYSCFEKLGFFKKNPSFFVKNASYIIEKIRDEAWNTYLPIERKFMSETLAKLISEDEIKDKKPLEAIEWFIDSFPQEIYELSLSNTQSRRSRAGKEFEAIIELILIGSGISLDSQGNIGKKYFADKGLSKLVDIIVPGVIEYTEDKSEVILISAKTTLRERWQEVPEEMSRTGAKEMFLVTLDETISSNVLNSLYEANIRVTTTKNIKNKYYANNKRVLDFEKLLEICILANKNRSNYKFSEKQIEEKKKEIEIMINKHCNSNFVVQFYQEKIKRLGK